MASLGIPLFVDDGISAFGVERSGTSRGRCLLVHRASKCIECHGMIHDEVWTAAVSDWVTAPYRSAGSS